MQNTETYQRIQDFKNDVGINSLEGPKKNTDGHRDLADKVQLELFKIRNLLREERADIEKYIRENYNFPESRVNKK